MDWNILLGTGVAGVLSALGYQALKGDGWSPAVNLVLGAVVAYFVGFSGLVDQLPQMTLEGNGSEGVLTAFTAAFAHGQLFKGKPLGQAIKMGLVPRLLNIVSQLASGLATAAKNEKPPGA